MYSEWKNWCRFCGSEDKRIIDISIKDEQFKELTSIVENFLSITIKNLDKTTPKICALCREILINFMEFSTKVIKVQEMFTELYEENHEYQLDINKLRNKYGLNNFPELSPIPIVPQEEDDLFNKIENDNNTTLTVQPLFVNVDIFNPENIKTEISLDDQIEDIKPKTNLFKNKTTFRCEICSKKFLRQSNLTTHLKLIHSIESKKKILPCEICGKTFGTQQKLTAHSRTHIPLEERSLHQCPNCEQKLSCEASLKQHIRSKHTGEKTFICDQCGKSFSTKQEMKVHKYVHDTDNEFQCKKCIKIFKNEFRLKVHMKVHRDRMYPCSICGLQLKTPKTLKNHLIIHTDEMPFSCNYCGATFRRDKNLRAHMIIHTGLKPYECPFCNQSYANRSNCKKHQKHSHPEEFAALEASGIQHYSKNVPKLKQLQTMLEQMKTDIQSTTNS